MAGPAVNRLTLVKLYQVADYTGHWKFGRQLERVAALFDVPPDKLRDLTDRAHPTWRGVPYREPIWWEHYGAVDLGSPALDLLEIERSAKRAEAMFRAEYGQRRKRMDVRGVQDA